MIEIYFFGWFFYRPVVISSRSLHFYVVWDLGHVFFMFITFLFVCLIVSSSNVRPKYPWLRSASVPAIRLGLISPPLSSSSSRSQIASGPVKPSTLNLSAVSSVNNDIGVKNVTNNESKSALSSSFSPTKRESRKPTITEPLSLAKQQRRPETSSVKQQQPPTIVHSPVSPPNNVFAVRVGGQQTNLTPIMENVATRFVCGSPA